MGEDGLHLHSIREEDISFDGIANSFPVQTYLRHTSVRRIRCVLELNGENVQVTLFHRNQKESSSIIGTFHVESGTWSSPWITLPEDGRLVLCLKFRGSITLHRGVWEGLVPSPERKKFLISIPAYRRNASVLSILNSFVSFESLRNFDISFLVIDHGDTLTPSMIPQDSRLHLISQPNYGASGGFMRAYLFAKDMAADYLITADDDILLFPEMFFRMVAFQLVSIKPVILGSLMLTIQDPTVVSEQGARIIRTKVRFAEAINRNTPLENSRKVPALYEESACDYTAWWLSCSPVNALSVLPPYFIRGEDALEGLMAQQQGVRTIVPPHCFVWHEAFSLKSSPWRSYLSFRNDLTNRLIMGDLPYPLLTSLSIFSVIFSCIINYDYNLSRWYIMALEEVLSGPEWIQDPVYQTKRVHQWMKEEPPPLDLSKRLSHEFEQYTNTRKSLFHRLMRRAVYILTGANYFNPFAKDVARDGGLAYRYHGDYQGWGLIGFKTVAVINPDKRGYICVRSWSQAIMTTISLLVVVVKFYISSKKMARDYKKVLSSSNMVETWRHVLSGMKDL